MLGARLLACVLLCIAVTTVGARRLDGESQSTRQSETIYSFLSKLPWDAETTRPIISPCPQLAVEGRTLQDIGRCSVVVGSVVAIVPTRMTTIRSRFAVAPNLYDGLPRDAKVLYLLGLLDESQWRKISGDGLGLDDCHGEQAAVLNSILPDPFRFTEGTVSGPNSMSLDDPSRSRELTPDERRQVKLRVSRHLELTLPLAGEAGFTGTSVGDSYMRGEKVPFIVEDDGSEFGQRILIDSENVPKKSQLDTGDPRLGVVIALRDQEPVGELLSRIGAASGIDLIADPHYAPEIMFERGSQASASDLLRALALGVAGTFRRVGSSYVLTCNLSGIAAHQLRVAAWEDDIEKVIQERESLWRSVLAKSGALKNLKFKSPEYEQLSDSELSNLEANDKPNASPRYIDTARAGDAVRKEVSNFQAGSVQLDRQKVGIHSSARYQFVFPDGSTPWDTGWVAEMSEFSPTRYVWLPPKTETAGPPLSVGRSVLAAIFNIDSAATARWAVAQAHRLGMRQVWLESASPESLAAAKDLASRLGVEVGLAVRPWEISSQVSPRDLDATVAGDSGNVLAAKETQYVSLNRFWLGLPGYRPVRRDSIAPLSAQTGPHWANIETLAQTHGVSCVALLDAYPNGYATESSRMSRSYLYSVAADSFSCLGYAEAQRVAFLRTERVDPLDIENDGLRTGVPLVRVWGDALPSPSKFGKWQKARGTWAHDAVLALARGLANTNMSILLSAQHRFCHVPPDGRSYLYVWKPGRDLPMLADELGKPDQEKGAEFVVIGIQDDDDQSVRGRVAADIGRQVKRSGTKVVLDFSRVPTNKLRTVLARWLIP